MRSRILLKTLGCSKNTVDSERVAAALSFRYDVVSDGSADIFLLNTCSFIADAKQQSIDTILEAVALKGRGVYHSVVVFGCLGERYSSEMPGLIPEVDAWFGVRELSPMLDYFGIPAAGRNLKTRTLSTPSHYAYLKISEGCDRHCSYCAIPLIRGPHKSVPAEVLVEEAGNLAAKGVKELIVIAQDSTYYGLDLYGRRALADLLDALSGVDGIEWIRLHYSYPAAFPEDVLDIMASNPKICKYLDIPLQHASSKVLGMMHRGVDEEYTRRLVEKMRGRVPGVTLRTTMIVGHPGETDEDFRTLLDFVRDMRFERLGAFTYSEEEDTWSAAHYEDDIPESVKAERYDRLMSLQESISLDCNLSLVGNRMKVITDSFRDGLLCCRGEGDSPEVDGQVYVPADSFLREGIDPASLIGQFLDVRVTSADTYDLYAEPIR